MQLALLKLKWTEKLILHPSWNRAIGTGHVYVVVYFI